MKDNVDQREIRPLLQVEDLRVRFESADGVVQAVGAGVLRGVQDTRVPMVFALIGYWVVGIGVGTLLAFPFGLQGVGIWLGLASGLGAAAVLLVARWTLRERLHLLPHQ